MHACFCVGGDGQGLKRLGDHVDGAFFALNMAMHDAGVGCWEAKFYYFNPRPSQLDPSIKTQIGLPNFPSYTSGHSTFSAAGAAILSYLFPSGAGSFAAMRDEAGISRLYGGIHYPSDIEAGKLHGARIAWQSAGQTSRLPFAGSWS